MADIPHNIQSFNLICLKLFARLYEAFPNAAQIQVATLGTEASPLSASYDQTWDSIEMTGNVVSWLKDEGFIRVKSTTVAGDYADVVLTLKALTLLGYVPTAILASDQKEPIIDKVKRVLASGAEKAAAEGVKSILTELFRLAIVTSSTAATVGLIPV